MEESGFWGNPEQSTRMVRESKNLKGEVDIYRTLEQRYEDTQVMIQMGYEENDSFLIPEIEGVPGQFKEALEDMRTKLLFSGEYDSNSTILRLNVGIDGTESYDQCSILYRMYCRWAEDKGFRAHVLDFLDDEEVGIKSATVQIDGENTYGYLHFEHGVHRLVRISPFNFADKHRISFVPCDTMPSIEEGMDIEANPDDIRVDAYRSSGVGGQHISKTSLTIRITHFPTRIVVTCQNERSQFQNKERAMQVLRAKLLIVKQEEQVARAAGIHGDVKDVGWRSQIRSYVLQPCTMARDRRTGEESGNMSVVLDGATDNFISVYLR